MVLKPCFIKGLDYTQLHTKIIFKEVLSVLCVHSGKRGNVRFVADQTRSCKIYNRFASGTVTGRPKTINKIVTTRNFLFCFSGNPCRQQSKLCMGTIPTDHRTAAFLRLWDTLSHSQHFT